MKEPRTRAVPPFRASSPFRSKATAPAHTILTLMHEPVRRGGGGGGGKAAGARSRNRPAGRPAPERRNNR
ncbi:hypothetical protein EASAB2608_00893 [Streptomyces sp. EAS-AB2608]|nr:hypothetical protein EASAB2608_00893 [Streptomyces sp. EAS-AB2608]